MLVSGSYVTFDLFRFEMLDMRFETLTLFQKPKCF